MLEYEELEHEEARLVVRGSACRGACKGGGSGSGSGRVSVDKTSSAGERGELAVETVVVWGPGSFSCETSFLRRRIPKLG